MEITRTDSRYLNSQNTYHKLHYLASLCDWMLPKSVPSLHVCSTGQSLLLFFFLWYASTSPFVGHCHWPASYLCIIPRGGPVAMGDKWPAALFYQPPSPISKTSLPFPETRSLQVSSKACSDVYHSYTFKHFISPKAEGLEFSFRSCVMKKRHFFQHTLLFPA